MRRSYTKQEKFDYVMECRSSGLSDYQWCKKNNISPSTFYNWTQQLKKIRLLCSRTSKYPLPFSEEKLVVINIQNQIPLPILCIGK